MSVPWWAWVATLGVIGAMLTADLLLHRRGGTSGLRGAALWSAVWVLVGLGFGGVVWATMGGQSGSEYFTGYLIEKSLSVDNVVVFALLLSAFAVPAHLQHRVLFYGVLGALVMRGAFVAAGTAVLEQVHAVFYVFGAVLLVTGARMALHRDVEVKPERNPVLRLFARVVPTVDGYRGSHFVVKQNGRRHATVLLTALVAIEVTDLVFAIDSIPAIFGVTTDLFIVFTSNAFAVLGLRALYFLLADVIERFRGLRVGLAVMLVFIGLKMLLADVVHLPQWAPIAAIAVILTASAVPDLVLRRRERRESTRNGGEAAGLEPEKQEKETKGEREAIDIRS